MRAFSSTEKSILFIDYSCTKRRRRHAKGPTASIIFLQCPPRKLAQMIILMQMPSPRPFLGPTNSLRSLFSARKTSCGRPVENVLVALSALEVTCATYSPCASKTSHDSTRNRSGPQTPRALEDHARNSTCGDAVVRVVLATVVADGTVEAVVHHCDHTSRVAEEGASPCDGVEDGVETQFRRRRSGQSVQSFRKTPYTSQAERAKVCDTSAVAQVIRPPSGGQE